MFKFVALAAIVAVANGDYLRNSEHSVEVSSPSLTSDSSNILRGPGNLAQVLTYSKTIETPYSTQRKSDVRISSPTVVYSHSAPYSPAPSVSHVTYNAGPVAYATAPSLGQGGAYGPSYSADHTVGSSHESTVKSLDGSRAVTHYSKAVDTAFSSVRKSDPRLTNDAKILSAAYAAPTGNAHLGPVVAYSAAPDVARATFTGLGTEYNW
ncbi:pupal cuticle protein C1B-like [Neodiprion virginianus]|uniref:pupal cuticle protein C1B-like n=1 Tax=Neodiprion virginianus TaxID=2961670 RepID=UPI001EE74B09|nr:pupal cuticle protein C1B-like [Neodiprion virginianus]